MDDLHLREAVQNTTDPVFLRLNAKWSVYSHGDLKQRCKELGSNKYLIEGLIPDRSLSLLVGDSGLGKSALVYQLALCIAAGVPFLGRVVKQGRVLCLDFEDGLGQVDEMLTSLCAHLGLIKTPDDLLLWNLNDCQPKYGQSGNGALDMIRDVKPLLTVMDLLTGLFPEIEDRNSEARKSLQKLREVMRDCGTSIIASQHIRKPAREAAPPPLETCMNVREWFLQTRGASALINGTDIRLGVDEPRLANGLRSNDDSSEEVALVLRGFGRVRGEIPLVYLSRRCDEDGEPIGYKSGNGSRVGPCVFAL